MKAILRVDVELKDSKGRIIPGEDATFTRTIAMEKDELTALIGDGKATVSMGFDEKISPGGTYSSVGVRLNITLTCNQDAATIRRATDAAFLECVAALDDVFDHAVMVLQTHQTRAEEAYK